MINYWSIINFFNVINLELKVLFTICNLLFIIYIHLKLLYTDDILILPIITAAYKLSVYSLRETHQISANYFCLFIIFLLHKNYKTKLKPNYFKELS